MADQDFWEDRSNAAKKKAHGRRSQMSIPTGLSKAEKKQLKAARNQWENERVTRVKQQIRWTNVLQSWEQRNFPLGLRNWASMLTMPMPNEEVDRFQRLSLEKQEEFLINLDRQVGKQKKQFRERIAYAERQKNTRRQPPEDSSSSSSDEAEENDQEHQRVARPKVSKTYQELYGNPLFDFPPQVTEDDDIARAITASLVDAGPSYPRRSDADGEDEILKRVLEMSKLQAPPKKLPSHLTEEEQLSLALEASKLEVSEAIQVQEIQSTKKKLPSDLTEEEQLSLALEASKLEVSEGIQVQVQSTKKKLPSDLTEEEQLLLALEASKRELCNIPQEQDLLQQTPRESLHPGQTLDERTLDLGQWPLQTAHFRQFNSDEEAYQSRQITLKILFPSGLTLQQQFPLDATLAQVRDFIGRESGITAFTLRSTYPLELSDDSKTLAELGITGNTVFRVQKA